MSLTMRMSWSPHITKTGEALSRFAVGGDFKFMLTKAFGTAVSAGTTFGKDATEAGNFLTVSLFLGDYGTKTFTP